jgi:hypothetical protein
MSDFTAKYVLSSERAPHIKKSCNCQTKEKKMKNVVMGPKAGPDTNTDWPTDRRNINDGDNGK